MTSRSLNASDLEVIEVVSRAYEELIIDYCRSLAYPMRHPLKFSDLLWRFGFTWNVRRRLQLTGLGRLLRAYFDKRSTWASSEMTFDSAAHISQARDLKKILIAMQELLAEMGVFLTLSSSVKEYLLLGVDVEQLRGLRDDDKPRISVAVFLDTDEPVLQARTIDAAGELAYVLGFGYDTEELFETGSVFKVWLARIRHGLTSPEVRERLEKVEAYAETYLSERTALVNSAEAAAFNQVVKTLDGIPNAVVRVGTILVVKYTEESGGQVLLSRPLSVVELKTLERYPEIQKSPKLVMELLGGLVAEAKSSESGPDDEQYPPLRHA